MNAAAVTFFLSPDMIRRRVLRTRSIKMLVLDEADEMLNKGFKEQIYDVYRYLPPATQVNKRYTHTQTYVYCIQEFIIILINHSNFNQTLE
jgi:hypothetical protein